jgi:HEAT repeats/PBS lyase HEAT-like repeat
MQVEAISETVSKYDGNARMREQVGLLLDLILCKTTESRAFATVQLSLLGSSAVGFLRESLGESIQVVRDAETLRGDKLESLKRNKAPAKDLDRAQQEIQEAAGRLYSKGLYQNGSQGLRLRNNVEYETDLLVKTISRALGILATPDAVKELGEALPRMEAVEALAKIGTPEALELLMGSLQAWYHVFERFDAVKVPEGQEDAWRKEVFTSVSRQSFVKTVFSYFDGRGVGGLLRMLLEKGPETKRCACNILAELGDKRAGASIVTLLKEKDAVLRTAAVRALARLDAQDVVPLLSDELYNFKFYEKLFLDEASRVHIRESEALASILSYHEELMNALLKLADVEELVGIAVNTDNAIAGVERFRTAVFESGSKALPYLAKMTQFPEKHVQKRARDMIERIEKNKA